MDFGETGNRSEPVRSVRPEGGLHRQSLPSPANLRPPPATRACAVFLMLRLDPWPAATPVPARCSLCTALRGCSQRDTAGGTSWHGYGLLPRHRAPRPLLAVSSHGTEMLSTERASRRSANTAPSDLLLSWRVSAAEIPMPEHFHPLSIMGSRDAGGREKTAVQLGQRLQH